ncbi:hypothetical protein R84B8_01022 [Treponema sp. R8-4-B8]
MTKKIILIWVILFFAGLCYGQSNFAKGEELLMRNQPAQAESFLIRAISDDPGNPVAYIYLGIVYEQIGRAEDAISIYRRILPSAGNFSANVANNLGNVYFQKGSIDTAEQYYTQAIGFDSNYPNAYLGRANTRVKTGNLKNAISDYEQYLRLDPRSKQRAKIEQLVNLIRTEAAEAEMKRLMAEEEARRIAEERQRLLDSVSASLQSVVDSSKGISSGTESVENYDGEFVLE